MVIFRKCRTDDLYDLQLLVDELYADDPGARSKANVALTFKQLTTHPENGCIVVFDDGDRLIGYAILIYFWSNEYGGLLTELDELLVSGRNRGHGVATNFFKWLASQHRENLVGFALQVSLTNIDAIRLYEKVGFRKTGTQYMVRVLSQISG